MPQLSDKTRNLRSSGGLSQSQLAARAGISLRTVQFAEAGQSVSEDTVRRIAGALEVAPSELIASEAENAQRKQRYENDAFSDWPWALVKPVAARLKPLDIAKCADASDALSAIQKMRDSWEDHLSADEPCSSTDRYVLADQALDQEIDCYKERYLGIWKRNPKTLLYSASSRGRNGVSVVLPVSNQAYEKLRDGSITFMDITDADVLSQSQNIILDSAVELAGARKRPWHELTRSLGNLMFYQIAALSQNPMGADFRMLSFGASSTNSKRLVSMGFVELNQIMPEYGYRLYEFAKLSGQPRSFSIEERQSVFAFATHRFKKFHEYSLGTRAKQRVIARMLKLYQEATTLNSDSNSRPAA